MEKVKNITNCDKQICTLESGKQIELKKDLNYIKDPKKDLNSDILSKLGASLRALRKSYGLSAHDLAELVGVSYRTIENYETSGSEKVDIVVLIKCLEVFNNMADKDGNYRHYSLDYLVGLSKQWDITNELIYEQIGLDNEAIEQLGTIHLDDMRRDSHNIANSKKDNMVPEIIRTKVINYFLSLPILAPFCEAFIRYIDPKEIVHVFCDIPDETRTHIKTTYVPGKRITLQTSDGNKSRMVLDSKTIKAITKNTLIDLSQEYINGYEKYIQDKDFEAAKKKWIGKKSKDWIEKNRDNILADYYDSFDN